jgi:formamidopyrimidine-DNA glycosylase
MPPARIGSTRQSGFVSEGPEVRRTAERLAEALAGQVTESVELRTRSGVEPEIHARLIGARVHKVRTYGKHLVIEFTRGVFLHNHRMMFGKWRTYARADFDAGRRQDHHRSQEQCARDVLLPDLPERARRERSSAQVGNPGGQ